MNNIEEAQLLRSNRKAIVEQLNSMGFSSVDDSTPLSDIAKYMQWAGGLLDVRLATISKTTKQYKAYTRTEWDALSASNKAACIKLGVEIRAEGHQFIIAKEDAKTTDGKDTMAWGPTGVNVRGLTDFGVGNTTLRQDWDGEANTDTILAFKEGTEYSFPAAETARAYKASTVADGGIDDPTKWSLPAEMQLRCMYKYRTQINAELTYFFGSAYNITTSWIWGSTEYDSSNAWLVGMGYGYIYHLLKTGIYKVRPVSPVAGGVSSAI